ncbi:MAG: FAD-dependent oxidoreductase [Hyphomicrobiaceae bacterium]|nr:FAD-dependent oxidoreductase [Hyphomicrobiaceae bacterium]
METLSPDICVIGAGSGGLTVAAASAQLGASVVLIEAAQMGGDCLNYGCVPSKAFIASAKRAHTILHTEMFGVATESLKVNFGRIHEHVQGVIDAIAPNDSVERFEGLGVRVIQERGRFTDRNTVTAGDYQIRARRFVIATGSRAAIPPIEGLADVPYFTNETIFQQTRKPGHLLIIGAGPIGMELAQAHRRLGAEVTVIDMASPLAKDDPELVAIVRQKVEAEGVAILDKAAIKSVAQAGQSIAITIERNGEAEVVTGSHLLVAAGRKPNVDDLGLDAAGIRTDRGAVKVSRGLRTSNRKVYAIGDVAGALQFTHMAGYQAGLVVRNALFGLPVRVNTTLIPWATYTDPELAHVGLNEAEAKKRHGDRFRVVRVSYAENDRARAEHRTEGMLKVIFDRKGRILGATIAGLQAGEIISLFAYAIANKLTASSLTKFVAPYPTLTELVKRAGVEFYRDQLGNPWLARLRRFARLLP